MLTDEEYWFWLSSLKKTGPVSIFRLLSEIASSGDKKKDGCSRSHDSPDLFYINSRYICKENLKCAARIIFSANPSEIKRTLSAAKAAEICSERKEDTIHRSYENMINKGIRYIPYYSEEYPSSLRHLYDPPVGIFVKGNLPGQDEWLVSVIGARSCSEYGRASARSISRGLAFSGISIISGMARGIDSISQWGCIDGGARTYAVTGCGPDICYPSENIELYHQILSSSGGIISEYPPGSPALAWHFPLRNRLIAAMSAGIVVIEAKEKSGSLITVERGLELGRNIYAVPGRANDPLSRGCNRLIHDGAELVTSASDILESFGLTTREYKKPEIKLSRTGRKVYSKIGLIPSDAQKIAELSGLSINTVMSELTFLELSGYIRCVSKNSYVIRI